MAFGGFEKGAQALNNEINTTPLVDVMLVLLVVFILITPVVTHSVKVDLPDASSSRNEDKPETVTLAIDVTGAVFWNDQAISDDELLARLSDAGKVPNVELHIRADKEVKYQRLAEIMSAAQYNGVLKLGFVTEPVRQ